jgi:hypothetical protein
LVDAGVFDALEIRSVQAGGPYHIEGRREGGRYKRDIQGGREGDAGREGGT